MNLLSFFRSRRADRTADMAKERLQILLAHERSSNAQPDFLPRLRRELVDLVSKYANIDAEKVSVNVENSGQISTLEVNIELPSGAEPIRVAS